MLKIMHFFQVILSCVKVTDDDNTLGHTDIETHKHAHTHSSRLNSTLVIVVTEH